MHKNHIIRHKTLLEFANLVSKLDGDLALILSSVGFNNDDLSNPQLNVSYQSFIKLIEFAAKNLNYPAFGLRLSSVLNIDEEYCLNVLTKRKLPFHESLLATQNFLSLYNNRSDCWDLTKDEHLLIISRYTDASNLDLSVQEKELSYGVYLRVLQKIMGQTLKNCRIEFTHNNMTELHVFKKFLKVDVAFNQECERIILDSRNLNLDFEDFNTINCQRLRQRVINISNNHELDIEQKVKNLIMQNMINKTHTIENIARKLVMHPRSLQRRLEEKNLTFKQLLNDLRIDVACWHLKASNKSITLISEILGYNEVSSFSRTFKKQKNCSALQWRKSHAFNA